MRITKFIHASLLVEHDHKIALIDPGVYSWEMILLQLESWLRLDTLIITHEHADHFYLPAVQAIVAKFPEVPIVASSSVAQQLQAAGINHVSTSSIPDVEVFDTVHEPIFGGPPPPNIGVHYQGLLTHPGDSHSFTETKDILALPITAPWGSYTDAVNLALKLRPKYIVPIHDWHYRPEATKGLYERCESLFAEQGIIFFKAIDGQPIDVG